MAPSTDSEPPIGHTARDWTVLWRIAVFLLAAISAAGVTIGLYASSSYIKEQAGVIVIGTVQPLQDLPPRVRRLEEVSQERKAYLDDINAWRRTKDEIDTRLLIILENQQSQLNRQQTLIDSLAQRAK